MIIEQKMGEQTDEWLKEGNKQKISKITKRKQRRDMINVLKVKRWKGRRNIETNWSKEN